MIPITKHKLVFVKSFLNSSADYKCRTCNKMFGDSDATTELKKQKIKSAKIKSYKTEKLKKRKIVFSLKAKTNSGGKLSYKVTKGKAKFISVSKSGKVTLKKKCKKGTYNITIIATASGYAEATKVVKIKVK